MKWIIIMSGLLPFLLSEIVNTTGNERAEQITRAGLKHLGLEPKVTLVNTPGHRLQNRNYVTRINDEYFVYLDEEISDKDLMRVLPHELHHIKQYEEGLLNKRDENTVEWDGKVYDLKSTPADNRPWEIDAQKNTYKLSRGIRKMLKNK